MLSDISDTHHAESYSDAPHYGTSNLPIERQRWEIVSTVRDIMSPSHLQEATETKYSRKVIPLCALGDILR